MVHSPVDPVQPKPPTARVAGEGVEVPESKRTEQLEQELSRELQQLRVVPRWVGWAMIVGAVLMLPWVAGLAIVLPERQEAAHYSAAWVGFDLFLCAMLLRTGWAARRGREHIELSAAMVGTLLLVDAWFDVITANNRTDFLIALGLAVFAEIPMAVFCLWIAGRVEYRRQERAQAMIRIVRALRRLRARHPRHPRHPRPADPRRVPAESVTPHEGRPDSG